MTIRSTTLGIIFAALLIGCSDTTSTGNHNAYQGHGPAASGKSASSSNLYSSG